MPDFSARSDALEIMDNLDCAGEVVHQTLRELEFINTWLGGNAVTLKALDQLIPNHNPPKTITIADLGCGGGDMLRLIDHWAKQHKRTIQLIGIDANPHIITFAKENLKTYPHIRFLTLDIFSAEFRKMKFDVVIGTLFYHHFSNDQLISFFRQLNHQVSLGLVINDIHRHPLAYYAIKYLTHLFSRSAMVKFDAPLSVLRAFRKKELIEIFEKASIQQYTIQWKWAFRWQVVVKK